MSEVRLRTPVEVALHFLAHRARRGSPAGDRECSALLRAELIDLTEQLVESRMQVLVDRAELDAYRSAYGPLERLRRSA